MSYETILTEQRGHSGRLAGALGTLEHEHRVDLAAGAEHASDRADEEASPGILGVCADLRA